MTPNLHVTRFFLFFLSSSSFSLFLSFSLPLVQGGKIVPLPLILTGTLPMPNNSFGRIDHLSFDSTTQQLFVSGFGDSTVAVVDVEAGVVVETITDQLANPQGNLVLPFHVNHPIGIGGKIGQEYVANDETGAVEVYGVISDITAIGGEKNLYPHLTTIDLEEDADNVRYNSNSNCVYVGYGDGAEGLVPPAIAVIDPLTNQILNRLSVPAHPESFQLNSAANKIYVNTPNDTSITVLLDVNTTNPLSSSSLTSSLTPSLTPSLTWRVPGNAPGGNNECFPMALAEEYGKNGTLFVGCRTPPLLAVLDAMTGEIQTTIFGVGDHADDLWWDSQRQRLYLSSREGFVNVIQAQNNGEQYSLIANVTTAYGGQTSYFDPLSSRLFVPIPKLQDEDPPAHILVFKATPSSSSSSSSSSS